MTSITEVIEVHQEIIKAADAPLLIVSDVLWSIFGIVFIVHLIKDRITFSFLGTIYRTLFLLITLTIVGYLSFSIVDSHFSIDEKEWEEEYLEPYINSLPTSRIIIEDFSQLLVDDHNGIKSIYVNKQKPIWFELSVLDDKGIKQNIAVQSIIQKEPIEKPYLTYKQIEKDISAQYTENLYYETILHIPNEYKVIAPTN